MNFQISQAQFGVRPPVVKPIPEFLIEVGEEGIRDIISKHYDLLKDSEIADLFPKTEEGLKQASKNASDFFIQICGGQPHFTTNRGAPRMVGRHAPFRIDAKARKVWLELFMPILKELQEQGVTETSIRSFWGYLDIFSIWMINTQS